MFTYITGLDVHLRGTLLAVICLSCVVVCLRVIGLRAFSKMTWFDLVTTSTIGSLVAGCVQAMDWSALMCRTVRVQKTLAVVRADA